MPSQPIHRRLRRVAKGVVRDLFRAGNGQDAARLVLITEDARNLGAWARRPVEDRVYLALVKAVAVWRETHG